MSKKNAKVTFSDQHSTIDDIEAYYVDSEISLDLYFDASSQEDRFFGYSLLELQDELKNRKNSLDRMCSLEVLGSLEAHMRIDYLTRCQEKLKDKLSRQMRVIHGAKGNRASLVDDIMFLWKKEYPEHKASLDEFQKALDYRNWLAHGRYWTSRKTPHIYRYDYLSICTLANKILIELDLLERT